MCPTAKCRGVNHPLDTLRIISLKRNIARLHPTAGSIRRKKNFTCEPPRHGSSESLRFRMSWSGFGEELEDDMPVRLKEAFIMS